ncbi:MAG: hydrolase [Bacillota bacterium]|nr:hydrolase [Bacillota bacterium]
MENRNFLLGTEWNIIHYPEKPTGFGILIIGDERHFVDENKSFWLQNEGKLAIIKLLKESGYTIFSSNLYGKNWGSEVAVEIAQRLYQHIIRSEIINSKIHVIAEGMGALVAIKLMDRLKGQLRSLVFLNPILSLSHHLQLEKENKFFYKKLTKELEVAYQKEFQQIEKEMNHVENNKPLIFDMPVKLIHVMSGGRAYNQSNIYRQLLNKTDLNTSYILPEKKMQIGDMIVRFFKENEKEL